MKNFAGSTKGLRTAEAPDDRGFVFLEEASYAALTPPDVVVKDEHDSPASECQIL